MKILIVGAGLAGCTCAALLKHKHEVVVLEQREHIAGNCYDGLINNVLVQQYGAHIFHTNNKEVWDFVKRFSDFNNYEHKVMAYTYNGTIPVPFNNVSKSIIGNRDDEWIKASIFQHYSSRQWGMPYEELPEEVKNRIDFRRNNDDCRYFTDKYQGIPIKGYTKMMQNMLQDIDEKLGIKYSREMKMDFDLMIYTGMIDEYFKYEFGKLPYRSLWHNHLVGETLPCAVINNCRIGGANVRRYDNSKFYGNSNAYTVITDERSEEYNGNNIPMYPMEFNDKAKVMATMYREKAKKEKNVLFIGRLATYSYMNMDKVIDSCIDLIRKKELE